MNHPVLTVMVLECIALLAGRLGSIQSRDYSEAIVGDWVLDEEATVVQFRTMAAKMGEEATDEGIALWLQWGRDERCSFHADGTFKDHRMMSEFSVAKMPSAYVGEPIRIVNIDRWSIVGDRVYIEQLENLGRDGRRYPRFRIDGDRLITIFEDYEGTVTFHWVLKKVKR